MSSHATADLSNKDVLVYILYCTDDHGLERYVRKTVKASIGALSKANLERRLKKCFGLCESHKIKLLRKSKRSRKYVDIDDSSDYKILARSAFLKKCVLLVMIDEPLYEYYKDRASVFNEFLSRKGVDSNLCTPNSSVSTLISTIPSKYSPESNSVSSPSESQEVPESYSPAKSSDNDGNDSSEFINCDGGDYATKNFVTAACKQLFSSLEERLNIQIKDALATVAETSTKKEKDQFEKPKSTAIHRGVFCDSCFPVNTEHSKPITGTRYKCLECYDFDLCENCERNEVAVAGHNAQHSMVKIVEPSARASIRNMRRRASTADADTGNGKPFSAAVHHGVYCDSCYTGQAPLTSPIKGCRYKCLQCADFDLCEKCEAKGFTNKEHTSDHIFAKVCSPLNVHSPFFKSIKLVEKEAEVLPNFPNIYCDFCCAEGKQNSIISEGICYCCAICPDFHMCESCHKQNKEDYHHKSYHSMKAMLPANLVKNNAVFSASLSKATQSAVLSDDGHVCAKCDSKLIGSVRYVCAICDQFVLCHACYNEGVEHEDHRSFHKMIAIIDNKFMDEINMKNPENVYNREMIQFASDLGISGKEVLSSLVTRSSLFTELCSLIGAEDVEVSSSDEAYLNKMKEIINDYNCSKGVKSDEIEDLTATVETLDISIKEEESESTIHTCESVNLEEAANETENEKDDSKNEEKNEDEAKSIDIEEITSAVEKQKVSLINSDLNSVGDEYDSDTPLDTSNYEKISETTPISINSGNKSSSILILPKISKQDSSILFEQKNVTSTENVEEHSANGDDVVSSWSSESEGESSEFEILDSDIGF